MEYPLVSIIVPVYNVEKYVRRCVDSLIYQTYQNIEIILVDDGSPDRCGEICDEYAKKDSRVKAIHKPNGGLSDARNKGLDVATGDYVMFVDSDDWLELNTCEILNSFANDFCAEVVIFGLNSVYDSGKVIKTKKGLTGCVNKEDCLKYMIYHIMDGGIFNYVCNKFFSAHLFEDLRFPIGRLAEDQGFTYKLIHKANIIYVTEKHLYNYYQRSGSISSSRYYPRVIKDRHELWLDRLAFIKEFYPRLENYQVAQIMGIALVSLVKLRRNKENKNLIDELMVFVNQYKSQEKYLATLDKRVWLHYYCYPLFWLYTKLKVK